MKKAVQILVSGKVQGVFFRISTQEKAVELGITGWVKNQVNGQVEIHAEGIEETIEMLIIWCRIGPKNAVVTGVSVKEVPLRNVDSFTIVR